MGQEEGPGDIMRLFAEKKCVTIAAPMVRFSRLPFRHVVRSWGCDIVYTPMIMAESFVASQRARDVEMHTNAFDRPVIVQFAADSAAQFAAATELVAGKVAGVDLNCGCPQQWAIKEGIGAALLKKPDTVSLSLSLSCSLSLSLFRCASHSQTRGVACWTTLPRGATISSSNHVCEFAEGGIVRAGDKASTESGLRARAAQTPARSSESDATYATPSSVSPWLADYPPVDTLRSRGKNINFGTHDSTNR